MQILDGDRSIPNTAAHILHFVILKSVKYVNQVWVFGNPHLTIKILLFLTIYSIMLCLTGCCYKENAFVVTFVNIYFIFH
jgi:hypothetical protein